MDSEATRALTVADGHSMAVPYLGSITVGFEQRLCRVGALVMGGAIWLGAAPMEDMDLALLPCLRQIPPTRSSIMHG